MINSIITEELRHYSKLLYKWEEKGRVKIETSPKNYSYFDPTSMTVFVKDYKDSRKKSQVVYHELGHHFLNSSGMENKIGIEEFWDECDLLEDSICHTPIESDYSKLMNEWSDIAGSTDNIRILSDVISCLTKTAIPGYVYHDPDSDGRNYGPSEGFAELFSVICNRDYYCYSFMKENFPEFVNSCLWIIDSYLLNR